MRKILLGLIGLMLVPMLLGNSGCNNEADVASRNVSLAADNFEVQRRLVFYNGITDTYILSVEGLCSIGNDSTAIQMSVTCKVGHDQYVKHFLGRSDNVTYFAEQLRSANVSGYHYKVIFRPLSIIPDIDIK